MTEAMLTAFKTKFRDVLEKAFLVGNIRALQRTAVAGQFAQSRLGAGGEIANNANLSMAQFQQMARRPKPRIFAISGDHRDSVRAVRQQIHNRHAIHSQFPQRAFFEGRRIPQHQHAPEAVEHIAADKFLGALVVIGHMNREGQLMASGGAADGHGGGSVGGSQVPGHYQEGDLVGVAALEGPANRVELVAQLLDRGPNPLFRLRADAPGSPAIVEDIRDRGVGNTGGPGHVFDRGPRQK